MIRRAITAVVLICCALPASAQTPAWRFRWKTGDTHTYRVEQETQVTEVTGGRASEVKTKVRLTRRWQVTAVDDKGIATVQMTLTALRMELTNPAGKTRVYDTADEDNSDVLLTSQLIQFVGKPVAMLRVDDHGRVVEVKESKFGVASRFEAELPFALHLPETALTAGQTWERSYKVTLEPPKGTGEKYDATQKYTCQSVDGGKVKATVTTQIKGLPEAAADQVPLLQMMPEGEVVFDVTTGRLQSAQWRVQKELKDHQGPGSSHKFTSSYKEDYLGDK